MIKSLIILCLLKCALCQRDCPASGVVTTTDGVVRYELVFNCMVRGSDPIEDLSTCDPVCCASRCQGSSNCNIFHVEYNTQGRPWCSVNNQGSYQYESNYNCRPSLRGYAKCVASCPAGQEILLEWPCTACRVGTYKSTSGLHACIQCPEGEHTNATGAVNADACIKNITAPGTDIGECAKFGYHRADATTTCTVCPVGKSGYSPNLKLIPASDNYNPHASNTWVSGCFPCQEGQFKNDPDTAMCTNCPSGKISSADRLACDDCPAGTTTFGGFWRCEGCHQGTHAPTAGSANCTPCPAGSMSKDDVKISPWPITACIPCPVGQAARALMVGYMCTNCPAPSFTHKAGALSCQRCNPGSVENVSESTGCTMCAPGTYQSRHATQCVECTAGKYSKQGQGDGCDQCPAGTFVATPASAACIVCTPGSISDVGAHWCSSICTDHTNEVPAGCLSMQVVLVIVRITRMPLLNFTLERQTKLREGVGIFFEIHQEQVGISEARAVDDGMLDVRLGITSARHRLVLTDIAMKKQFGPEFASLDFDVSGFQFPSVIQKSEVPPETFHSHGHRMGPGRWAPIPTVIFVIWKILITNKM